MQHFLMVESHWRKVKRPLMEGAEIEDIARVMWEAPFGLLAHNRGSHPEGTEPVFTFANKAALEVFEAEWDELVGQPSRVSAPDDAESQEGRNALLASTADSGEGYSTGLTVLRRSRKGTMFQICDMTLWNIETPTGKVVGQAARFDTIKYGDGPEVRLDGGAAPLAAVPTVEEVAAQDAAVQEQAARVRSLKTEQGLTNSDPAVAEAVAVLLEMKDKLAAMQSAIAKAAAQSEAAVAAAGAAAVAGNGAAREQEDAKASA